jgi:branched-chain amino acid transport system ATP-binding protein
MAFPVEAHDMMPHALELKGLVKRYGSLLVTDDVSLHLAPGARHALIGPNGAGKSTLVHQISGVVRPDSGEVILDGHNVTSLPARRRVALGLGRTFQVTNLFPALTVMHNLFLALSERAGRSRVMWRPASRSKDLIEEAESIAERLSLSHCLSRPVREIAYGEQRLLEIAVALALRPKVLLLDEPAAGIPKSDVGLLLEAMARLPAETAILLIEHDMLIVREFARSVSVLVEGRIVASGAPADVLASEQVRAVYLGAREGRRRIHADSRG